MLWCDEPQKHYAKPKKPDHVSYSYVYMKYVE